MRRNTLKRHAFSLIQALIAALLFTIGMQTVFAMLMQQRHTGQDLRQSRTAWRLLINCSALKRQDTPQATTLSFDQHGVFDQNSNHFQVHLDDSFPYLQQQVRGQQRTIRLERLLGGDL